MTDYSNANGVRDVQNMIHYSFEDEARIWEAIQAPGALKPLGHGHLPEGNKRLALLGDTLLRTILIENSYASGMLRRRAQERVSAIACNSNLALVGREQGIDEVINPAPGTMAIANGTIADTVEAIIGAVYLDGGISAATRVIATLGLL